MNAFLSFENINHIHGGEGFPLVMLCVVDGIMDVILEESLNYSVGFLRDESKKCT